MKINGKIIDRDLKMIKCNLKKRSISTNITKVWFDFNKRKIMIDNPKCVFNIGTFVEFIKDFFITEDSLFPNYKPEPYKTSDIELVAYDYLQGFVGDDTANKSDIYFSFDPESGNITGFIIIILNPVWCKNKKSSRVRMLYVNKSERQKGIATDLLQYAENIAVDNNKTALSIRVIKNNTAAYSLYKKFGFKESQ